MDAFGHDLFGPQDFPQAQKAVSWAIDELRERGALAACLGKAYEKRATGDYFRELYGTMTCFKEVERKRHANRYKRGDNRGFDVSWCGKAVHCRNLKYIWPGAITPAERRESARCAWLPATDLPVPEELESAAERRAHGYPE